MEQRLYNQFKEIAYDTAGISLNENKRELVTARVGKRLRALDISSPAQYLKYLKEDPSGSEIVEFLDAMSTNFTFFFREKDHFELLTKETNRLTAQGRQRLRFWCAASSSGEEPYSIVITILEALAQSKKNVDFKLLATDISTKVLNTASSGIYNEKQVKPLSRQQRTNYLDRLTRMGKPDPQYEVKPKLKKHIVFKRLNLSKPPFPLKGPLDMVFCRNVMIYFDQKVRQNLISEVERVLAPGSLFIVGHSETLTGIKHGFQTVRPSVYRKPMRNG